MERGGLIVGTDQVLGVVVDGSGPLHFVLLRRTARQVELLAQGTADDAGALAARCGTRVPVALALAGPRCIHRVTNATGDPVQRIGAAFPHAPLDQLFLDGRTEGAGTGVSMVRRDQVAAATEELRTHGFRIVHRTVGPWPLLGLRTLLAPDSSEWQCGEHRFRFQGADLVAHDRDVDHYATDNVEIGSDLIPRTHALAWAAAWDHLVPGPQRLPEQDNDLAHDRRQEKARIWYERTLVAAVLLLLVLLGADQTFRHLAGPQATAGQQHRAAWLAVDSLRQLVADRRALVAGLADPSDGGLALRAARLVAEVPAGIELDRLWADPLQAPLREREEPQVRKGTTLVEGTCTDAVVLNTWVRSLHQRPGISGVRLVSLTPGERDARPRFTLQMDP